MNNNVFEDISTTFWDYGEQDKSEIDPSYFYYNHCKIDGVLPDRIDPQTDALNHIHNNRFVNVYGHRPCGKSRVALSYVLYTAIFGSDKNIIIGSHTLQNTTEMFRKLLDMVEGIESFFNRVKKVTSKYIEFTNGSKISIAIIDRNMGRGMSFDLIYLDNMYYRKDDSEVYPIVDNLFPTMQCSTNSRIILTEPYYKILPKFKHFELR